MFGASLQAPFMEYLKKQKLKLHHKPGVDIPGVSAFIRCSVLPIISRLPGSWDKIRNHLLIWCSLKFFNQCISLETEFILALSDVIVTHICSIVLEKSVRCGNVCSLLST